MNTRHEIGDPSELAASYAAGGMSTAQQTEFESHLDHGCRLCRAELAELSATIEALAVDAVAPPASVRDSLLAKIAAEPAAPATVHPATDGNREHRGGRQIWRDWKSISAANDLVISRASDAAWEETGVSGVRIRRLSVDQERDQFTALVRMEAGSAYPKHVHNGPEECLVIEGELRVGAHVMKAGDYQFAPPGSLHGIQSTDRGCLLLIVSSLSDEMV